MGTLCMPFPFLTSMPDLNHGKQESTKFNNKKKFNDSGCLILNLSPLLGKPWSGVLDMGLLWKDQTSRRIPKLMVAS